MKSPDFQLAQMTKKREDLLFFGPSKFLLNISLDLSVLIMCFRKLCVEAGRAPKKIVFCLQILMFNVTEENPQKPPQTQHTPLKSCEKCHDSRIILHGIFMQQFHKVQTYLTQAKNYLLSIIYFSRIEFRINFYGFQKI